MLSRCFPVLILRVNRIKILREKCKWTWLLNWILAIGALKTLHFLKYQDGKKTEEDTKVILRWARA